MVNHVSNSCSNKRFITKMKQKSFCNKAFRKSKVKLEINKSKHYLYRIELKPGRFATNIPRWSSLRFNNLETENELINSECFELVLLKISKSSSSRCLHSRFNWTERNNEPAIVKTSVALSEWHPSQSMSGEKHTCFYAFHAERYRFIKKRESLADWYQQINLTGQESSNKINEIPSEGWIARKLIE